MWIILMYSIIYRDGFLESEMNLRTKKKKEKKKSKSFGNLKNCVESESDITIKTKLNVYKAYCLSVLLHSSEFWTANIRFIKTLEKFIQNLSYQDLEHQISVFNIMSVCLFVCVLWHINLWRLLKAKSIFIPINSFTFK